MMQSVGYLLAAAGPAYVGSVFDLSGSWNIAIFAVVFICILQVLVSRVVEIGRAHV